MKRLGIIVLSFVLLYAGVAWALDECFALESHADHLSSENHHDSNSTLAHADPSQDSSSVIHCPFLDKRLGLATNTPTVRLPRPANDPLFIPSDPIQPLSIGISKPLFLADILSFSFHANVSHHLFLSVLHI